MLSYAYFYNIIIGTNILFELIVGLMYLFNTERQILLVRGKQSDSKLPRKYAKSFGITLICLCFISIPHMFLSGLIFKFLLIIVWILYHSLVIWNNIIFYNKKVIIIHSIFLFFLVSLMCVGIVGFEKFSFSCQESFETLNTAACLI